MISTEELMLMSVVDRQEYLRKEKLGMPDGGFLEQYLERRLSTVRQTHSIDTAAPVHNDLVDQLLKDYK